MPIGADLYLRHALATVSAALQDTRVVVINGARQTGKSTLARLVAADHTIVDLRFLDDAGTRSAAATDPAAFVRHQGLMVIDEVQRVPDLAGHLAGITRRRADHPTAPIGPLSENFVLAELARQLTWAPNRSPSTTTVTATATRWMPFWNTPPARSSRSR